MVEFYRAQPHIVIISYRNIYLEIKPFDSGNTIFFIMCAWKLIDPAGMPIEKKVLYLRHSCPCRIYSRKISDEVYVKVGDEKKCVKRTTIHLRIVDRGNQLHHYAKSNIFVLFSLRTNDLCSANK